VAAETRDRVGLLWRDELAAGIFANLDKIDTVQIIAEDYFHTPRAKRRALRLLAQTLPLDLHGVAMGLASTIPAARERMENMARLAGEIEPESWSEHMAFVRAGSIEIGHLAAPPRTEQSITGTVNNIKAATRIVGSAPLLENIATLIDPPASTMGEAEWTTNILRGSGGNLLLDLHNLYANALNFGQEPSHLLAQFPLERVKAVHLSGGVWITAQDGQRRLLDDHLHDPPPQVYELLTQLSRHAPQALSVIIERDGHFPDFRFLLGQLEQARAAMRHGRQLAAEDRRRHELSTA
jgi:uncharacterized protein (UPF0276 family)